MKINIIVPCFNEEDTLNTLYSRLSNVMNSVENHSYEIIFINDGSKDKTEEMLLSFEKTDNNVKVFSLSKNFGHQAAVSCGIHNAKGDIAIIIDADLQDPPEILPDMIKLYEKTNAPIIYGKRISREGEIFFKTVTAKLFYRFINLMSDTTFPVDTGDFRLIDKNVIEAYKNFNETPKYIRGIISWMGFEQIPFEYDRKKRIAGTTKYTFNKMLKLAITGILSFSTKPLRISLFLGVLSIAIALMILVWVLYLYFNKPQVLASGWASIIITILFMGGAQMVVLSIIGEYIANIFNEIKKRPEYIVKNK